MFYRGLFEVYDFQISYQKVAGPIVIEYKIAFELVICLDYKISILRVIFCIKKIRIS
jgi:hypothetical protein